MKLAVPFELRIFLVVVLVGIISVLVILDMPDPTGQATGRVVQGLQQPGEPANTLIISGIDIGQAIGFKSPTISGNEFACFSDQTIVTNAGRATARFFLSLYDTVNGGCTVEFAETETDTTGTYMRCRSSQKAYDYTIRFEPSLNSEIADDELEDYLDETVNMFGMPYTFVKTKILTSSNTVRLRLISPVGTLDIEDNYADTTYSEKIEVNGKRIKNGLVRVRGSVAGDEFMMHSIEYRLFPQPKIGKDVFVQDHQGTKQHLMTPEGFLGDFDILFRGIGSAPPRVSTPRPSISQRYSGNVIAFDAAGDDTYRMIFTNNQGRRYSFPLISVESGALESGDGDKDFIFQGAAFAIDQGDFFAVTDRDSRQGVTNIVQYTSVDSAQGLVYLTDLAGDTMVGRFDTTTGASTQPVVIGGGQYDFNVNVAAAGYPMEIDHDGNGAVGGEAIIISAGGVRVDLSATGGTVNVPASLFADEAPAGGESVVFAFAQEDGDIDVTVTSGVTLIKNDASGKNEGLTTFGMFVQRDNRNTANDLVFHLPSGQSRGIVTIPSYSSAGGQAQGEVLVTCERSEFVKRAQEAKKKA